MINQPLTHTIMIRILERNPITIGPVRISVFSKGPHDLLDLDAVFEATFDNQRFLFGAEVKSNNQPKAFEAGLAHIKRMSSLLNLPPLIVLPWLSDDKMRTLAREKVSGLDLSGNVFLYIPDRLLIQKTGEPNKFKEQRSIQNVYSGESSIVGRLLLTWPVFYSLKEVKTKIVSKHGSLAMSTISKVLKEMAEDLVISKDERRVRLLQPEKLINSLRENYKSPTILEFFETKVTNPRELLTQMMRTYPREIVLSGISSASQYSAMASGEALNVYCSIPIGEIRDRFSLIHQSRFSNLTFTHIQDRFPYFDSVSVNDLFCSSTIQSWLEMSNSGDKRLIETAQPIEKMLGEHVRYMLSVL